MKTIKGPALFLAQFAGDDPAFDSWPSICRWAADCGYAGVQVPSWDARLFDLARAAESQDYCDAFAGIAREAGLSPPISRASSSPYTPPMTRLSTGSRRQRCAATPPRGSPGPWSRSRWH